MSMNRRKFFTALFGAAIAGPAVAKAAVEVGALSFSPPLDVIGADFKMRLPPAKMMTGTQAYWPTPLRYGTAMNIVPRPATGASLCKYVVDGAKEDLTVHDVYDRGVALARVDVDPSPGEWAPAEDGFVLGARPDGLVTTDVSAYGYLPESHIFEDEELAGCVLLDDPRRRAMSATVTPAPQELPGYARWYVGQPVAIIENSAV